jgi:predicted alpha/beta superfamily hydrolase
MIRFKPRRPLKRTRFFQGELADYGLRRVRIEATALELEDGESLAVRILGGKDGGKNLGETLMLPLAAGQKLGKWFFEWATREPVLDCEIAIVRRHPPTFDALPMSNGAPYPKRPWKGPELEASEPWSLTVWDAGGEVPWWSVGLRFWSNCRHYEGDRGLTAWAGHPATPARALFNVGGQLYDYCCDLPRRGGPSATRLVEITRDWNGLGERTIRVLLPRGYDTSRRTYPICYWHDGQNMFKHSRPADHWVMPWDLGETVERLTKSGEITDVIHVAVDNRPGQERLFEYLPPSGAFNASTDKFNEGGQPGEGDIYIELLRDFIHPYMVKHYRAMDDPQYIGMAGSSLGGLISMYSGWEYPDFARRLGVFSGTFWAAEPFVHEMEKAGPRGKRPLLVYLDSGTVGPTHDNIDGVFRTRDALIRAGWTMDFDLKHVVGIGQRHNESAWKSRLDNCLRFLWPAGDCFHAERPHLYRERVVNTVWKTGGAPPPGAAGIRLDPKASAAPSSSDGFKAPAVAEGLKKPAAEKSKEPPEMKRGGFAW